MADGGEGSAGSGTSLKEPVTPGPMNGGQISFQLLPTKLTVQDECLDKLLEETDNSTLNEGNGEQS